MRKGSIVLVPFPFTDLSGKKIRPALVLAIGKGEDCVVVFISSVGKGKGAFDVLVKTSKLNGLKVDSVIKTDKLATLQKKIILGHIGTLEAFSLEEVRTKLRKLFTL
jgi:mRNA interferase MazF